jgi:hypothetical protein
MMVWDNHKETNNPKHKSYGYTKFMNNSQYRLAKKPNKYFDYQAD